MDKKKKIISIVVIVGLLALAIANLYFAIEAIKYLKMYLKPETIEFYNTSDSIKEIWYGYITFFSIGLIVSILNSVVIIFFCSAILKKIIREDSAIEKIKFSYKDYKKLKAERQEIRKQQKIDKLKKELEKIEK